MDVYLVQHTNVAVEAGICYGRSDVGLASSFLDEAIVVKEKLSSAELDRVFSSPLSRCVRLAELFCTSPAFDARLQEYDFGAWEMQSWDVLGDSAETQKWFADYINTPTPNGESYNDMAARVSQFWQECIITQQNQLKSIAIITHAGVIRALLAHLLEIPLANAFNLTIDKGSVTLLHVGEQHVQINYINR